MSLDYAIRLVNCFFKDLTQSGIEVEPFFISNPEKTFDPTKFYTVRLFLNDDGVALTYLRICSMFLGQVLLMMGEMKNSYHLQCRFLALAT